MFSFAINRRTNIHTDLLCYYVLEYILVRKERSGYSNIIKIISYGIAGAYGLTYDHPASVKNKEADAGNPNVNVYHSIEDLHDDRKVEHLYDEIKQKEGQGIDACFDSSHF